MEDLPVYYPDKGSSTTYLRKVTIPWMQKSWLFVNPYDVLLFTGKLHRAGIIHVCSGTARGLDEVTITRTSGIDAALESIQTAYDKHGSPVRL